MIVREIDPIVLMTPDEDAKRMILSSIESDEFSSVTRVSKMLNLPHGMVARLSIDLESAGKIERKKDGRKDAWIRKK